MGIGPDREALREEVARIVDPEAFGEIPRFIADYEWHRIKVLREDALAKADQIAALTHPETTSLNLAVGETR